MVGLAVPVQDRQLRIFRSVKGGGWDFVEMGHGDQWQQRTVKQLVLFLIGPPAEMLAPAPSQGADFFYLWGWVQLVDPPERLAGFFPGWRAGGLERSPG